MKVYSAAVANFSAFHGRSPDKLGVEDVRACRLHLIERGLKASSIYPIVCALRFFYGTTLGRKEIAEQIPFARKEDALPAVLGREQIMQLLRTEPNLKMRTALTTIYAAGLRALAHFALIAGDAGYHPSESIPLKGVAALCKNAPARHSESQVAFPDRGLF